MKLDAALSKMADMAAEHISGGEIIGLGSGATVALFAERLGARIASLRRPVKVIPSSTQIQLVAERVGLEIASPILIPKIRITVDGADQIDSGFNMVKGGGGALLREEVLLQAASKRIILADEGKFVNVLSKAVPVEFIPFARGLVQKTLTQLGGRPSLRTLEKGYPYVTENSNFIFDTDFGPIRDPLGLKEKLGKVPGVVASGIFVSKGDIFYIARRNGDVEELKMDSKKRRTLRRKQ